MQQIYPIKYTHSCVVICLIVDYIIKPEGIHMIHLLKLFRVLQLHWRHVAFMALVRRICQWLMEKASNIEISYPHDIKKDDNPIYISSYIITVG